MVTSSRINVSSVLSSTDGLTIALVGARTLLPAACMSCYAMTGLEHGVIIQLTL